jgi:hypothetical protein
MHRVADAIERAILGVFVHIADATAAAIHEAGISRVGLLDTLYIMEGDFYLDRLQRRHGLEATVPGAEDRQLVHQINKDRRSLPEMTADWRRRAEAHLGEKPEQLAWVSGLAGRNDLPVLRATDLGEAILADAARAATGAVAARRATFSRWNVAAEALRILHGVRFASPDEQVAVAERITDLALNDTVLLSPAGVEADSRKLYTTETILQADDRLLDAARCTGVRSFPPDGGTGGRPAAPRP